MSGAATLAVRVTVTDGWRTVAMRLPAAATAGEAKRLALSAAGIDPRREEVYEVKFGGGLVPDAERLDAAGVPEGAGLVVLPTRRRPVR